MPNGLEILGQGLRQTAGDLGGFADRQRQYEEMVQRRVAALQEQARQEAEAKRQADEDERKRRAEELKQQEADRQQKALADFRKFQQGEQKAKPQAPPQPYLAPGMGPNGEASFQPPQEYETVRPTRDQLQQKALELGVYGDPGVRAYMDDTQPRTSAGLSFQERADLERLKAELGEGKPLTEYQRGMLQYLNDRASHMGDQAELSRDRLGFQKEKFARQANEQDTSRATSFVKNTNDLKTEISMFDKLDKVIPGGIYGSGGVSGFGFGTAPFRKLWKSEEANKIRPTLQFLINAILKRQSGAAVSDQEFDRMQTAFGINTTGTVEEFRAGLQNYYESAQNQYDRFVTADRQSARSVDGSVESLDPKAKKRALYEAKNNSGTRDYGQEYGF